MGRQLADRAERLELWRLHDQLRADAQHELVDGHRPAAPSATGATTTRSTPSATCCMPQNNPEGYERTSPKNAAKNLHGQLFLIHGTMDDNVHMSEHDPVRYASCRRPGKPFELMLYPKSRHGVTDPPAREAHARADARVHAENLSRRTTASWAPKVPVRGAYGCDRCSQVRRGALGAGCGQVRTWPAFAVCVHGSTDRSKNSSVISLQLELRNCLRCTNCTLPASKTIADFAMT